MKNAVGKERPHGGREMMELIQISENKLKIMLDEEDMARYALDFDALEEADSASRRAFWTMLNEARAQSGFHPEAGRIYVQIYPSRAGGCELFVTQLVGARTPDGEARCLYAFDSLGDLLLACRQLAARRPPRTRAYEDAGGGRFYLELEAPAPILSEYNALRVRGAQADYIRECCRMFCEDAVPTLAPLA